MKKIITMLFAVAAMSAAYAQDAAFEKGTNVISAGIGLGSSIGSAYSNSTQTPGFSVNFEHGTWEAGPGVVSIGGYLGIKSYKYEQSYNDYYWDNNFNLIPYTYTISQKWNYTVIGVRGAYHYTGFKSDKFDVYGGVMISYNILSYKHESNDPYNHYVYSGGSYGSSLYGTGFVGGRYYFSSKFGVYGELGYGVSFLNVGVSLKF